METNILDQVQEKPIKMRKAILKKLLPHLNRHLKNEKNILKMEQ